MTDWPQLFLHAHDNDTPYPNLTEQEPDVSLDQAYAIQSAFVARLPGAVEGYKGALTAAPAQAAMGIDAPVSGVLFDWGLRQANTTITSPRALLLETELGYRLADDITDPVSAANVLQHIATCHPMIELASPNMEGIRSGFNLIATNSASYGFIEGLGAPLSAIDPDQIGASFYRDTQILHTATSGSVMQGQASALAWLINQVLHVGGEVKAGMLLMSGAIGRPHPGSPGDYRADFGKLGTIEFAVG